jgi:hypothetical protein
VTTDTQVNPATLRSNRQRAAKHRRQQHQADYIETFDKAFEDGRSLTPAELKIQLTRARQICEEDASWLALAPKQAAS